MMNNENNAQGKQSITAAQILATLDLMNQLMHQESGYIKSGMSAEIAKMQEKKQECMSVIRGIRSYLAAHPEFIGHQAPETADRLRQLNQQFETIAQENFALLEEMLRYNKLVIDTIYEHRLQSRLQESGYNAAGGLGHSLIRQSKRELWVAVNHCA